MAVVTVNESNFDEEVLKADKPVLVDFWADWCGPCKMLSPIVEEIADSIDSIKVCKVNVDENHNLAVNYSIISIPTLLLFRNGEDVKRSVGYISKSEIMDFIS